LGVIDAEDGENDDEDEDDDEDDGLYDGQDDCEVSESEL